MEITEKNFIKQLKKQNEQALEYIVDQYLPLIKGITYKVLSPINQQSLLDECINDIFLSIWNNSKKFKGQKVDFEKWICAIAKFKAVDFYRKASNNQDIPVEQINHSHSQSPEDSYVEMENNQDLINLLNQLKPIDKEILIRKYYFDESSKEIAQALDLSITSVDNRIYRGKKKLSGEINKFELGGNVL
ncbi:sigma-70 family RNA polymerase sigma factor [Aquisalibacillus elongatus]|uniref:RNA polymerase sigma-70 factor (ECF subfamily) n=1 Tax=Aquisalibacillus elongatus TaxID=485577 RepID=A0A3N5BKB2_9BACI|nr:sigma-70 family RNA polymerase sigma factor [Aquisalibacillus elongatus]RPF57069.1 RNA polymerase sigma-70 factor (ECF subfamily) [Aquisalibacillus elongatus]